MTTTPISSVADDDARPGGPGVGGLLGQWRLWAAVAVLGGLFVAYHHVFLQRTWMFAMTDRNWSHVLLVPLISAFYIYLHRHRLAAMRFEPGWWGLPLLFLGLFGYAFGIYPVRNDMVQGYSMIIALFGAAWWGLGSGAMRVLWFPILYLVFAVKVSDRIWEQVAWQLQQIAAHGATLALQCLTVFLNFDVMKRGATIELIVLGGTDGPRMVPLNVAEACSGLRMLMAFVALATAMAFLWPRAWWQRLIMVAMAVPIAVFVNVVRVTVLGLLALVDPDLIEGAMHTYIGLSMLLPAAALFWLLGWALERCVIRDESTDESHDARTPGRQDAGKPDEHAEPDKEESLSFWRLGALATRRNASTGTMRLALLGATIGIVVTLVAGLAYAGMIMTAAPQLGALERLGIPAIVSQPLMQLAWTLTPPAVIGGAIGAGAMMLLHRRFITGQPQSQPQSPSQPRSMMLAGYSLVVGVLLTMAIGHGSVLAATRAVLIKDPLPLRHSLWMIPDDAGPWTLHHEDPPLSNEQIEVLGTRTYLSRVYRDTDWPTDRPGGLARLHVAYYTGTPDTVPHVPERCFVAAGLTGLGQGSDTLTLDAEHWRAAKTDGYAGYVSEAQIEPRVRAPARRIGVSRFTFAHPGDTERSQNVFYFFIANGRFLATPDMVRLRGFDPTDRYSFYAKVEIQLLDVADTDLARARAESLMTHLLPEILACLPDWHDVQRGDWPTPEAASRAQRSGI